MKLWTIKFAETLLTIEGGVCIGHDQFLLAFCLFGLACILSGLREYLNV